MVDFPWLCQFTGVYTHVLTGNEKKTARIGIAEPACFSVMKFHRVSDLHPIGVHSSKLNSSPLKMVVLIGISLYLQGTPPFSGVNMLLNPWNGWKLHFFLKYVVPF